MTTDFRARDGAPLSEEEWRALDVAVQDAARVRLAGRRFLTLAGPLGAGTEFIAVDRPGGTPGATISLLGDADDVPPISPGQRRVLPLPILYRDFRLSWRDNEPLVRNEFSNPEVVTFH